MKPISRKRIRSVSEKGFIVAGPPFFRCNKWVTAQDTFARVSCGCATNVCLQGRISRLGGLWWPFLLVLSLAFRRLRESQ